MSQSQNVIYYTTAQVTELVELSDQNVRKYVRMLEDRDYEVAKDEHNRRLFSKKDVKVLQEMIKIAKSPGNTLESAADEIIENIGSFEVDVVNQANQVTKISDSEISRLLALVLEKLDEIQNENKELKTNINSLVHRLEEYDRAALEYTPYEEDVHLPNEEPNEELDEVAIGEEELESTDPIEDTTAIEETEEIATTDESLEVDAPVVEEELQDKDDQESDKQENVTPTTEQTDSDKTQSPNVDMSQTEVEETTEKEETKTEQNLDHSEAEQVKEPKKGFFGRIASMFK